MEIEKTNWNSYLLVLDKRPYSVTLISKRNRSIDDQLASSRTFEPRFHRIFSFALLTENARRRRGKPTAHIGTIDASRYSSVTTLSRLVLGLDRDLYLSRYLYLLTTKITITRALIVFKSHCNLSSERSNSTINRNSRNQKDDDLIEPRKWSRGLKELFPWLKSTLNYYFGKFHPILYDQAYLLFPFSFFLNVKIIFNLKTEHEWNIKKKMSILSGAN